MKRYTGKALEADIAILNNKLEALNSDMRFDVGYRYNYTAIDLCTTEQLARHCCERNLETGTPRECLHAARLYVFGQMETKLNSQEQ